MPELAEALTVSLLRADVPGAESAGASTELGAAMGSLGVRLTASSAKIPPALWCGEIAAAQAIG